MNVSYIGKSKLTQNYQDYIYYRYLSEGIINFSNSRTVINAGEIEDSVIYALGGSDQWSYADMNARLSNNIFVENNIRFTSNSVYENNVFLNNHTERHDGNSGSSFIINPHKAINQLESVVYVPEKRYLLYKR